MRDEWEVDWLGFNAHGGFGLIEAGLRVGERGLYLDVCCYGHHLIFSAYDGDVSIEKHGYIGC